MDWSTSGYRHFRCDQRVSDSGLDPPSRRGPAFRYGVHHAVLRSGCLGCYPYPLERALPAGVPIEFPRYYLPARQHDLVTVCSDRQRHCGIALHP